MANLESESWFKRIPSWIFLTFFPVFGGGALIWAGVRAKMYVWSIIGGALIFGAIVSSNYAWDWMILGVWGGQIVLAFILKQEFLVRTYPYHLPLPSDSKLAKRVGLLRGKIDINTCSKDDLVHIGLPIVYVNDIFAMRESGHIFTDADELGEMVGISSQSLERIRPLVTFTYNPRQEAFTSWRRANSFSIEELISLGLRAEVAEKLIAGRASGSYRSIVDITKRTGIPIEAMRELI